MKGLSKEYIVFWIQRLYIPFKLHLKINDYKVIDYTRVPLALVKNLKWDALYTTSIDGYAYACTLHKASVK